MQNATQLAPSKWRDSRCRFSVNRDRRKCGAGDETCGLNLEGRRRFAVSQFSVAKADRSFRYRFRMEGRLRHSGQRGPLPSGFLSNGSAECRCLYFDHTRGDLIR